jgi:hypothetical protein
MFTEDEQWDHNYKFFVIDKYGKIAQFEHVGFRLLPQKIAKSKENWDRLFNYFRNLNKITEKYEICPDLDKHLDKDNVKNIELYVQDVSQVSLKGLYSYDSYDYGFAERPYFRVTIPKNELALDDLPEEIKNILKDLRLDKISFAETSLIPEKIVSRL